MASGLLLGLLVPLVGGPGLFQTYSASARATCTPRTAFVSSELRLVKGYKLPSAAPEEKVTITIWPENWHVPEFVHRASGSDVRLSSFVDGTLHQPPLATMLVHMYGSGAVTTPYDLGLYNPGRPGSGLGLSAAPHSTERAPERHQRSTGKAQEPSEASVWIAPGIQLMSTCEALYMALR